MTAPAATTGADSRPTAQTPATTGGLADDAHVSTEDRIRCLDVMARSAESVRVRLLSREGAWSWVRLMTFLAALTGWYPLRASDLLGLSASGLCFAAFLVVAGRHREVHRKREGVDRELTILAESRRRLLEPLCLVRSGDRPVVSADVPAASSLLNDGFRGALTEQELDDLDVYAGATGLFGLLNRGSTAIGARRLAEMIERPMLDPEALRRRQTTLAALTKAYEARIRVMAGLAALRGRDEALERLIPAIEGAKALTGTGEVTVLRIWSGVSLILAFYLLYRVGSGEYAVGVWVLVLLVVNAALFRSRAVELHETLGPWRRAGAAAEGLLTAAQGAGEALPRTGELSELSDALNEAASGEALPALCRRLAWADAGGPMHAFFNYWLFYDLHVAAGILKIVVGRREALIRAIRAAGDLDALCGPAAFGWEREGASFPQISADHGVRITAGRHPLVDPVRCVANDVSLDVRTRMLLITGSNMSGKSTYLRMIGLNTILAHLGAAVCAEEMRLCPVRLVTDLRVRDNLAKHESYFLAEVRHLKRLVSPAEDEAPILGLIDEPFRGTNSDEQAAATLAVVEHLKQSPHFFVIATHERRVTELGEGGTACNAHFQENLDRTGMVFDYRLRPGPAATRNALRLLEAEAYPSEVTQRAAWWVKVLGASSSSGGSGVERLDCGGNGGVGHVG